MDTIGKVIRTQDGEEGVEVVCSIDGDDTLTADLFLPPGMDAKPIPGDYVKLTQSKVDPERWHADSFDTAVTSTTKDGEVRHVARDAVTGAVVASFFMAGNGTVTINGLTIDKDGNLFTRGKVTSAAGGVDINLHDHVHPHSMAPTKGPVPPPV